MATGVEVAEAATDAAPHTEEETTVGDAAGTGVTAVDRPTANVTDVSLYLHKFLLLSQM
jgi:hypothetical protein